MRRIALVLIVLAAGFAASANYRISPTRAAGPYIVTSTADPGDGDCATNGCTLREAIALANAGNTNEIEEIHFDIDGGAGGVKTILLQSELPPIDEPVRILGFTQGTASGVLCPETREILIEIDGNGLDANGLVVQYEPSRTQGTAIRGVSLINFQGDGVVFENGGIHNVQCSNIGVDPAGNVAGNDGHGVVVAAGVTGSVNIGGLTAGDRNIISGNGADGVRIEGGNQVRVFGNYIGTNVAGTSDMGNGENGVTVTGGIDVEIGSSAPGSGNVISGNNANSGATGIYVNAPNSVRIYANKIGTNAAGTGAIANSYGIWTSSTSTFIGSSQFADTGNLISGNTTAGVFLQEAAQASLYRNLIGTNALGTAPIPNGVGIIIDGAEVINVGGNGAGVQVISGNTSHAIVMTGGSVFLNMSSNLVGYALNGLDPLPNGGDALHVETSANGSPFGGSIGGEGGSENYFYVRAPGSAVANVVSITRNPGDGPVGGFFLVQNYYDSDGHGIDLRESTDTANTITENDNLDGDTGANGFQNFPVITTAVAGANPQIAGTFNSVPSTGFNIYFYASTTCSASHRTGERPLGDSILGTDENGNGSFDLSTISGFSAGDFITANIQRQGSANPNPPGGTAGDTSEFSACFQATGSTGPSISALDPSFAVAGAFEFELRVLGSGFDNSHDIFWDGDALDTEFINAGELRADISTATLGKLMGSAQVEVGDNPGESNGVSFIIKRSSSDTNCDGTASAADALLVLRALAGLPVDTNGCSTDVIGSNQTHISDVHWIRQEIAGLVEPIASGNQGPST